MAYLENKASLDQRARPVVKVHTCSLGVAGFLCRDKIESLNKEKITYTYTYKPLRQADPIRSSLTYIHTMLQEDTTG